MIVICGIESVAMAHKLIYGTLVQHPRKVIHVVRVVDEIPDAREIDDIANMMRERMLSKHGEQVADVVVVQGTTQENPRLFGDTYSVSQVRAALFRAAVRWSPIMLD